MRVKLGNVSLKSVCRFAVFPRMTPGMGGFQVLDGEFSVVLEGFQALVPKEFLDVVDGRGWRRSGSARWCSSAERYAGSPGCPGRRSSPGVGGSGGTCGSACACLPGSGIGPVRRPAAGGTVGPLSGNLPSAYCANAVCHFDLNVGPSMCFKSPVISIPLLMSSNQGSSGEYFNALLQSSKTCLAPCP